MMIEFARTGFLVFIFLLEFPYKPRHGLFSFNAGKHFVLPEQGDILYFSSHTLTPHFLSSRRDSMLVTEITSR